MISFRFILYVKVGCNDCLYLEQYKYLLWIVITKEWNSSYVLWINSWLQWKLCGAWMFVMKVARQTYKNYSARILHHIIPSWQYYVSFEFWHTIRLSFYTPALWHYLLLYPSLSWQYLPFDLSATRCRLHGRSWWLRGNKNSYQNEYSQDLFSGLWNGKNIYL